MVFCFFVALYSLLITNYTAFMNNRLLQIGVLIILAGLVLFIIQRKVGPEVTDFQSCELAGGIIIDGEPVKCEYRGLVFNEAEHNEPEVIVDTPAFGELVTSPMAVMGRARGFWYFEANLPIILKDDKGNILFQVGAQALGDWMTSDYVPFAVSLPFDPGDAEYGVLIIEKDNPSGLPEFDSSFAVPVRFK